jgi:hypothetical protein
MTHRGISRFVRMSGALAALLAFDAHAADLTLYADGDYQGRALSVVIDERQLGVLNFDKRASSVVIENGTWVLCSGEDYSGHCVSLEPGRYASLQALGLEDAVSSVRRRDPADVGIYSEAGATAQAARLEAASVVLFAADQYGGAAHGVDASQPDLRSTMKREASSAVIADGHWDLCSEADFNGTCVTLGPGRYPSLKSIGLERGASSLRRASAKLHGAGPNP